jgi:hypothetical protein
MSDVAEQIPRHHRGDDTAHLVSLEIAGLFRILGTPLRQRGSRAQPHYLWVLRLFDHTGYEACPHFLQRASAVPWRPFEQRYHSDADANRALGQLARRTPRIAGEIP